MAEINWQTKKKNHSCLASDIHRHMHTYRHTGTHPCIHGFQSSSLHIDSWIVSYWKNFTLPTLYNHLSSKLQQFYQLIKCTSLKETCHRGIQTMLTAKSLWWSKHIIKNLKDRGGRWKDLLLPSGFLLLWTEKWEKDTLFSWV